MKQILDACCGSRMFWFDKKNPHVEFCDNREVPYHEFYPKHLINALVERIVDKVVGRATEEE